MRTCRSSSSRALRMLIAARYWPSSTAVGRSRAHRGEERVVRRLPGDLVQHRAERPVRHDHRLHVVLGQQQRAQSGHQVEVEQAADAPAEGQRQLLPGRAVTHQPVRVHVDGRLGEDRDQRAGRVGLDRLDGQVDPVVLADVPQQPQRPLPQHRVGAARAPGARVVRADRLVPAHHLVEAGGQRAVAVHLVQPQRGLRDGGVVRDQQDPAGLPARSVQPRVQRRARVAAPYRVETWKI